MRKAIVATLFSSVLLLSACSGSTPEEQLDNVLNDTFEAEGEYRDAQVEMEQLESNEQQIFESIMALTQDEQEQVNDLAQQAIDSVEERMALLETERDSMEEAKTNFSEIDAVIEDTDDPEISADLNALKEKMQERFDAHANFATEYEEMSARQRELYELLQNEETELQTLQAKTVEVNEQNTAVQEAVTAFNEQTEQFNEMRTQLIEKLQENE
ncbi:MAG TPA: YkyA family protein [Planococcus sp. (in: firmicutes)]|nr:YkyA family protein [Planococcus sp. (in: firmicutes)]